MNLVTISDPSTCQVTLTSYISIYANLDEIYEEYIQFVKILRVLG